VEFHNKVVRSPGLTKAELEAISNRYDNGVLQLDSHLRVLFRRLDQKGYLENSIVVILGDHGDGLGEKGHFGHTRTLYQEEIRIPLLIYDPEKSRYRNSEFASQIDVAPTIVDRLGLPVPASWQGRSLLKASEDRVTYRQTRRGEALCFAVVERAGPSLMKYIRCGNVRGTFREEVYDLVNDPTEQRNLAGTIDRAVLTRLRAADARRSRVVTNACKAVECVD
jgi:arylsulfatase A-like enzyme